MHTANMDNAEILGPTLRATSAGLLTLKQTEVTLWSGEGKTNDEIAIIIGISPRTVKAHLLACCDRLGANSKAHLIAKAFVSGVLHGLAMLCLALLLGGAGEAVEKQRTARRTASRRRRDDYRLEAPLSGGPLHTTPEFEVA